MKSKTQVVHIHGGMTFKNKKDYLNYLKNRDVYLKKKIKWYGDYLGKKLGRKFNLLNLQMPSKENAVYDEWKIHFEKYVPFVGDNYTLIGTSLGGIFLARYLSENKLPKKALSVYLVCPPFDNSLEGEDLVGGFKLKSDLSLIEKNCKNLYLMFSRDDETVPLSHAKKYKDKLKKARIIVYSNKNGHFKVSKFPEIVKLIKKDVKNDKKNN